MHPIEACIQNPVKVAVGVLLLALFGFVALLQMPMQLTPEVNTPTITVETRWPGASPAEIEKEIVVEQEDYLKSVEGVTKMTSESTDSVGTITLEFQVGADMQEAIVKVTSVLQQVAEYPVEAEKPVIRASSSSDSPIAWFILSPRRPTEESIREYQKRHPESQAELEEVLTTENAGLAMLRLRRAVKKNPALADIMPSNTEISLLRKFAEDNIEPEFERVGGVANSTVMGGQDPEMQVIVNPVKLAARGLSVVDVREVLRSQNKDTSGGDLWEGKRRYVIRTVGQFESPEDIEQQLLAFDDGKPVYIRDVADVQIGYKKPDGFVRRFGDFALAINCQRETGANVLEVMEGLRATRDRLNQGVLKEQQIELTQVYDQTDYIYTSVGLVNQNIILGGALTVLVLMTFLHLGYRTLVIAPFILATAVAAMYVSPWVFIITLALILAAGFWYARGALVVGLAIPISIIGTFLMLNMMQRSLNVISLAGLAFAVGMLVDNAVVVLENIYRRYQLGDSPATAAFKGGKEVWGAVLASTLTTLAVFLPVIFVQEEAGQLFRDIALAISFAVGLSLIVSITVIPTASALVLRRRKNPGASPETQAKTPKLAAGVSSVIVGVNRWVLGALWRQIVVASLLIAGAVIFAWMLRPKLEYLPNGNRNLVICLILPPPGYHVDELMALGQQVEDTLEPYWNIDPASPEAKELDYPPIADFFYVVRGRQVFLGLRSSDPNRVGELIGLIRSKFSPKTDEQLAAMEARGEEPPHLPGAFVVAFQSSLFARGLQGGRTIDVEISGPKLPELINIGRTVMVGDPDPENPGQFLKQGVKQVISDPALQLQPEPSLDIASPEVRVDPMLAEMSKVDMTTTDLGYTINAFVDGAYATDYYLAGNDKIDLVIMGENEGLEFTQDIGNLPVATRVGKVMTVSDLAKVQLAGGPEQINHRERQRTITIKVTPPPNVSLEEAIATIESQVVANIELEPGYKIHLSGAANKLDETWVSLRWNLLFALLITYFLMAALFESFIYPIVIIVTVPLGVVGGMIGLQLLSLYQSGLAMYQGIPLPAPQSLDVLTMLGFVILIGTVVNNAILIVHQALIHMREEGMDASPAILESVRTRIRPIFMTTATTVFGLAPLVLFPGAGSELYSGLGSVVLGGLLVSTFFTLFLVPPLFKLMLDLRTLALGSSETADDDEAIELQREFETSQEGAVQASRTNDRLPTPADESPAETTARRPR